MVQENERIYTGSHCLPKSYGLKTALFITQSRIIPTTQLMIKFEINFVASCVAFFVFIILNYENILGIKIKDFIKTLKIHSKTSQILTRTSILTSSFLLNLDIALLTHNLCL